MKPGWSLLAACAALALRPGPARAAPEGPAGAAAAWGVASALEKLRPDAALPPAQRVDLAAARGECEAAQVAVRAVRPLAALAARAGPLTGPSPLAPALYRVATLELARGSGPDGAPGRWPDPLIPQRDPYFGEPRRAFPVAVAAGQLQAVWVELCVPDDARPGEYRGEVELLEGGRTLARVPLSLRVWPFALPAATPFTVTFGLPTRLGTRALGRPDDRETARALAAAVLRHRVTPHGLSYDPPLGTCTAARCELDWSAYDAEVGPVLDGTLVPGRPGGFALALPTAADWRRGDADLTALFRAWRRHFEARGWGDRLWLYTLDEPKPSDLPELARRAGAARAGGVRVFVTSQPAAPLAGLVDAYVPNVFFFEGRTAEDFRADRPLPVGSSPGRPFWYASCMSHGCDELPAGGRARAQMLRAFSGWPGYELDRPGPAARAMGWLGFRLRLAGELYYDMLEAWAGDGDPWSDVRRWAGNGDGTLLYPGLPARLGGQHPFPVESIRLKLIRDGIEDWMLLELARQHGLGELADRLAARLVPSVRGFERAPAPWLAAHRELGAALAAALAAPGTAAR